MRTQIEYPIGSGQMVDAEVETGSYTSGEEPILSGPADNWHPGSGPEVEFRVTVGGEDVTDELSDKLLEEIEESLLESIESDRQDYLADLHDDPNY